MKSIKSLAAKVALIYVLIVSMVTPSQAGIPVFDGTNVVQTTISAINQVAAVQQQIQQLTTQLHQYQLEIQNSTNPSNYVWNQANQTISQLLQAQNTLSFYANQAGSLNNYLGQYQNLNYYKTSPCFNGTNGCTSSQIQAIQSSQANSSQAVKAANDAILKGVDQQQQTLVSDAASLQQLQSQATSATGQMQAIQAANQFASAQANQLLQIRGLLLAQNTAAATAAEVTNDKAAQQAAASQQFHGGSYTPSPTKNW